MLTGEAVFGQTLKASKGSWDQVGVAVSYQWLRDDTAIGGATGNKLKLTLDDLGHRISVRVTASLEGFADGQADSTATKKVKKARFAVVKRPAITGTMRFTRVVRLVAPVLTPKPNRIRYQWLRDGKPIKGATKKRYTIGVPDVGAKITLQAMVTKPGYQKRTVVSKARDGLHLRPLRRTVTYRIVTRGKITADLGVFAKQAQATYDDPRGWRSAGIRFKRVKTGGLFALVLSQAALVPSFSSMCSSSWSCRVGDNVIINQTRWLQATPVWKDSGLGRRNYRHLVVNHETGHWLGHGHAYCGGAGQLAPVMAQQSKGLGGCKANPWPLPWERTTPRF
ncbi:MAG: DUF3152 domain-containing protein [Nocardioidaceae bacterium]|nr:MAG: DUF3152 domain-containing protein [Nocardioidaceae bacterium]